MEVFIREDEKEIGEKWKLFKIRCGLNAKFFITPEFIPGITHNIPTTDLNSCQNGISLSFDSVNDIILLLFKALSCLKTSQFN